VGGWGVSKQYRVWLEVVTSPAVTRSQLANLLGVPLSALAEDGVRRSIVWRYEPSTGHTGELSDRLRHLAEGIRPRLSLPRGGGFRRVSLAIDVRYDTVTCTVALPLNRLVYGPHAVGTCLPELSTVALTCSPCPCGEKLTPSAGEVEPADAGDLMEEEAQQVYERWEALGRPEGTAARAPLGVSRSDLRARGKVTGRTDPNKYIVSLDAITSACATRAEVADVLGLPPDAFVSRCIKDGAMWRGEVEADESVSLAERIRFLASAVHPRRPFERDGGIKRISLSIGVIWDVRRTEACSVRLPLGSLRSLARKLFVFDVEVSCYPGDNQVP
jgi:hypothetical protein